MGSYLEDKKALKKANIGVYQLKVTGHDKGSDYGQG